MEIACREESGEEEKWEARKRCNQVFQSYINSGRSSDSRSRGTQHAIHVRTHTHTHTCTRPHGQSLFYSLSYIPPPVYIFCRDGRRPMSHSTPLKCSRKSFSSPSPRTFLPPPNILAGPSFFNHSAREYSVGIYIGPADPLRLLLSSSPFRRATPIFTSHEYNHGHVRTRDTNNTGLCAGKTGYLPRWSVTDIANF